MTVMELPDISFASLSFDSSTCFDIICGSNGLPITPNSIRIIGNFKAHIEPVSCPYLTRYVDCFRNKDEKITLVFENPVQDSSKASLCDFTKLGRQLIQAIRFLHNELESHHGLISPDCIVTSNGDLKLSHWPLNLLTDYGFCLNAKTILTPNLSYVAPEQIKHPLKKSTRSCDIWSAGLSLLMIIKPSCKLPENPCRLAFFEDSQKVLDFLGGNLDSKHIENPEKWMRFFVRALEPDPEIRGSLDELESILVGNGENINQNDESRAVPLNEYIQSESVNIERPYLDVAEMYHLWRLSIGRNFESEQRHDENPPIFKIPYLIVSEKQTTPEKEHQLLSHYIIDLKCTKMIPFDRFKADIGKLDKKIFHPMLSIDGDSFHDYRSTPSSISENSYVINCSGINHQSTPGKQNESPPNNLNNGYNNFGQQRKSSVTFTFADLDTISIKSSIRNQIEESSKTLPIVIKEANFAYQCERIVLFKKLLNGNGQLRETLIREASIDIPPYYRAKVWANLLEVDQEASELLYAKVPKTALLATERQIGVDIPRCHQYNDLMASPQGHLKLARILKAWLNHNSCEYVYWQGLDSLASPFLLLNFDNEALAFACYDAFIHKYLRGMFRQVNQLNVQQYLEMFSKLLEYHDPLLSDHLKNLEFLPDLYAIPWFLTMFTHVLPLHKILHVWDCLMLGDEKFPLCIGLAILNQLRAELMVYNFNDCLGIFSDLPEIDIERCIKDANHFYCTTPDKLINLFNIPPE